MGRAAISSTNSQFVFPRWANYLLPGLLLALAVAVIYVPVVVGYGLAPQALAVGYRPIQPVPYSHALHAGELGIDCRYCHNTVDKAPFAALPPTQTCMNCHSMIKTDSPKLALVRQSYATGMPIHWIRVHDLAGYVYFNHAIHVNKGIGCVTCHGRGDKMDVVAQVKPLAMGWCLDCHRAPEKYLRPRDQVTNMTWDPVADAGKDQLTLGLELKRKYNIPDATFMTSCSTCHR